MLKRLILALACVAGLIAPVHASGTIPLSLTQPIDAATGKPLAGGKFYTFAAGTTTPQNAYSDSALTIPLPNPITLDAAGRLPQMFFADGSIKIRLTNKNGVVQIAADGILVIGPSSGGGGGGGSVDATTVLATGDVKTRYGTGVLSGFVRLNGRTIGSASSGATERANSDCQPLFEYLWNTDANLAVSTGRGASSIADWTANKVMALPDSRGRVLASLDDMGSTAAGRLTPTYFGSTPTTLGAAKDGQSNYLALGNLPAQAISNYPVDITDPGHSHGVTGGVVAGTISGGIGGGIGSGGVNASNIVIALSGTNISAKLNWSSSGQNATPFGILPPMLLITTYIKL